MRIRARSDCLIRNAKLFKNERAEFLNAEHLQFFSSRGWPNPQPGAHEYM